MAITPELHEAIDAGLVFASALTKLTPAIKWDDQVVATARLAFSSLFGPIAMRGERDESSIAGEASRILQVNGIMGDLLTTLLPIAIALLKKRLGL